MNESTMSSQIIRHLKPDEEEVFRKRAELASIQTTLAELELELTDLRSQLAVFEGRYLRQVGVLYAELDEWNARIFELQAKLDPSISAEQDAQEARDQARQTHQAAHGTASKCRDFNPSPELRGLFREVAKKIHPDLATDSIDREVRTRLMAEANRAYQASDAESLRRILDEYQEGKDGSKKGSGTELENIIQKIRQAKERVSQIEQEIATLRQSEIAKLKQEAEAADTVGRNLLLELAAEVRARIKRAREQYEALERKASRSA